MSTDYQQLLQKFNNFKKFISENAKDPESLQNYEKMTENEFLFFGISFLLPNKDKLEFVSTKVTEKTKMDPEHKDKVKRYLECFVEYLDQLNSPELQKQVLLDTIAEKGIKIPEKI